MNPIFLWHAWGWAVRKLFRRLVLLSGTLNREVALSGTLTREVALSGSLNREISLSGTLEPTETV